jgi:hypothetical protein
MRYYVTLDGTLEAAVMCYLTMVAAMRRYLTTEVAVMCYLTTVAAMKRYLTIEQQ